VADDRQEALRKVPLFANLPTRQLKKIAARTGIDDYREGTVIVREGGHGETLFVILEGSVRVVRGGRIIAKLLAGEFFGELSVIDGRPRTADVVAETDVRCLVLYRDDLKRVLTLEPTALWTMLETVTARYRAT
jgi:CRP-like cAMP-binding protein